MISDEEAEKLISGYSIYVEWDRYGYFGGDHLCVINISEDRKLQGAMEGISCSGDNKSFESAQYIRNCVTEGDAVIGSGFLVDAVTNARNAATKLLNRT